MFHYKRIGRIARKHIAARPILPDNHDRRIDVVAGFGPWRYVVAFEDPTMEVTHAVIPIAPSYLSLTG